MCTIHCRLNRTDGYKEADDDTGEVTSLSCIDEPWEDLDSSSAASNPLEYSESRQLSIDGVGGVAGCKSTHKESEGEDEHLQLPPYPTIQNGTCKSYPISL